MKTKKKPATNGSRRPSKPRPKKGTVCILCGSFVPAGQLLNHKVHKHGEERYGSNTALPHKNTWVPIYQGGLPGLGKHKS